MKKSLVTSITLTIITLFAAVSTAQAAVLAIISQPLHGNSGVSPAGQSFTATATGVITIIRAAPWSSPPNCFRLLTVYAGEGNTGPLLHSQWHSCIASGGDFETVVLTNPVPVTAGQVYTFYPSLPNSLDPFYDINTDPYPGGSEGPGSSSYDLKFEVVIEDGPLSSVGSAGDEAPDDRINWKHGDDYAPIYVRQDASGRPVLHVYCINTLGEGYLGDILTQEIFDKAPPKAPKNTKVGETTACRVPVKYYVLTTGEYQVNIGPDYEGKVDVVVFTGLPPKKIYYYRLK